MSSESEASLRSEATATDLLATLHRQESRMADPNDPMLGLGNQPPPPPTTTNEKENDIHSLRQKVDEGRGGAVGAGDEAYSVIYSSSAAGSQPPPTAPSRPKVFLNVYNLVPPNRESAKGFSSEVLNIIGMGMHHSGVELLGQEYSFGSDESGRNDPQTEGVYSVYPRTACGHFKQQIELGEVPKGFTVDKFEHILATLRPKWRSATYNILSHNCNHFTMALVSAIDALGDGEGTAAPPATIEQATPTAAASEGDTSSAAAAQQQQPIVIAQPAKTTLMSKYPLWVNRAAVSANVVVPLALVRSITDAIHPPSACAPDLVNFIDIPAYEGDYPEPFGPQNLPPSNRWVPPVQPVTPTTVVECDPNAPRIDVANGQQPQWGPENTVRPAPAPHRSVTATTLGGLAMVGGFAKKLVRSVRTTIVAHVDDSDKRDYTTSFEGVRADDLLSSYVCTVIHVNRPQKAKVFIAVDGIRVKGSQKLHMFIPYSDIRRYFYGAVIRPDARTDGNALPYFVPIEEKAKDTADCILLVLQIEDRGPGLRMIPLIDFSYLGTVAYAANAGKSRDVLKNAMAYLDFAHRAASE